MTTINVLYNICSAINLYKFLSDVLVQLLTGQVDSLAHNLQFFKFQVLNNTKLRNLDYLYRSPFKK